MKTKLFISVYIDIGSGSSNSATVAFDFGTTSSTSRQWDIKVAQIPCGSSYGYTLYKSSSLSSLFSA